jgi:hypothetical protein
MPVLSALSGIASAANGIVGAANSSGPTSLETDLQAKAQNNWGSSFAVGTGSRADSSPSQSSGSALGNIPPEYLLAGVGIAAALAFALLRK